MGVWVDHLRMIIQMNDSKLRTIEQIELFLSGNVEVAFSMQGDDTARYAHISRVFKRLAAVPLLKHYRAPAAPFKRKYLAIDIELLVEMDKANENVCGPATAHLLKRAYQEYGDERYVRLAKLLEKLRVEQTKSRARHRNDNA
jgi:hypothetical protein